MPSRSKLIAVAAVAAGVAVMPTAATAAQGGVSVSPASLESTARSGASTTATVRNTTNRKLKVTVTPRPWRQARSGAVSANRARTLSGVALSRRGSRSPPARGDRSRAADARPSSGSLFGALESSASR